MAQQVKAKKKVRKSKASKPALKQPAKKKAAAKKKKAKKTGKKIPRKKAVPKNKSKKSSARATSVKRPLTKESVLIEPGPPSISLIPVEEPAANEEAIGTVTHYYSHLGVAIVQINTGLLKTGMTIHVKGHTTDFIQSIESMEYEHHHVDEASPGQSVGIKVLDHAREHDIVFAVR